MSNQHPFWASSVDEELEKTHSRREGLSNEEARVRLRKKRGPNFRSIKGVKGIILFLSQLKSPLVLLLIGAAILSTFLHAKEDALIIIMIVSLSALLGFFQEFGAIQSLEKLLSHVEVKANVLRDGNIVEVPIGDVVFGDVVQLEAGDRIPGDCLVLESNRLLVDESSLTGESDPSEKKEGTSPADAPQRERNNGLFKGTNVLSGKGLGLVVAIGKDTIFGAIEEKSRFQPPETAFEKGTKQFGFFLMILTVTFVSLIFILNLLLHRPLFESLLFSLALAVGFTPQLLPAVISVNLSHGSRRMAKKKVIVKRLASIENFGLMNVLCSDKTGTVTEGALQFERAVDPLGQETAKCRLYGTLNAHFQSAYPNPLDNCILAVGGIDFNGWEKIDEIPYDFDRKRLSVRIKKEGNEVFIVKGAVPQILEICKELEWGGGEKEELTEERKKEIEHYFEEASKGGFRSLAVGYSTQAEEKDLCFLGFLHFQDPIKKDIAHVVSSLKSKGILFKIITGDHHFIALHVASHLGLKNEHLIKGSEIGDAKEDQLLSLIQDKEVFSEIEPHQKENIILALRKSGKVVGYLGDGINDISALHSADVGISVDKGADAAKEASDIVLLQKSLQVLLAGVEEGRHTFANTIKYVYMAVSANFGNMFSMAGASLFLPFLPLLPKQVLLMNLLTDIPEMAIASDRVDPDLILKPVKWDLKFICKFMVVFGLISSLFDYCTFGVLFFWMDAKEIEFRTGWFIESVVSAAIVALVIRTKHWFFYSRPGTLLTICVGAIVVLTSFLPISPLGPLLGFTPIPIWFYGAVFAIVFAYLGFVELSKRIFFRKKNKNP